MKKIAILPIRSGSKRFPGKNFFPILGVPLYKLVLKKIIAANIFDDIVIATDEPDRVLDECNDLNIKIFHRSESSSSDFAQSEDILCCK
jgi:CMP-N-acetylneuraminic acid synthetase